MRYTLRLLTTQQFVRAAAVMLACEAIRRGRIREAGIYPTVNWDHTPFSIGLWVGSEAVPNRWSTQPPLLGARRISQRRNSLSIAPPVGSKLTWEHDEQAGAIHVRCETKNASCSIRRSSPSLDRRRGRLSDASDAADRHD